MIIYGWNNRIIKNAQVGKLECPHCKTESVWAQIVAFYVHIFWIPLFPYKKSGQFACSSCNSLVDGNELSETVKLMKKSVRFPLYLFSGLGIIVAFVTYMFVNSNIEDKKELGYLSHPEKGDIYHLKDSEETSEYKYYLWKVDEVFDDSLYVSQNAYSYNGLPDQLLEDDGFYDTYYVIDKSVLEELHDSGELVKIQREYGELSSFSRTIHQELDSISSENI